MSYSHIVFCGDSYMKCYIDAGGHLELCKQLNAEPILLYRSGSAHEYVINHLYDKLSGVPKALVVWGLSHASRIDVPWSDDNNKSMWATLNYDHLVGNDGIHNFYNIPKDDRKLNVFIDYLMTLLEHNHLFIKRSLEHILDVTGWLKSQGHDYIIWNQAAKDFETYGNNIWPVILHAKADPGIYKIFSWYMNQALYDHGVPPRPDDLKYYKGEWNLAAHPLECPELVEFVNTFILQNLQNRNLI